MSASLIGRFGSSAFRPSTGRFRRRSRARASLRNGTRAFHHGVRERGKISIGAALPTLERRQVQADMRSHLIHRPARDILPPRGGARVFSYTGLILHCHASAASCRLQLNSVPSTQMRCMITASRRASATIAFFMPRRLATCIAQALSQDHRVERTSIDLSRFVEHHPHHTRPRTGYAACVVALPGLILAGR